MIVTRPRGMARFLRGRHPSPCAVQGNELRNPALPTDPMLPWIDLPKVLLHEHLDGGLRPQTLLDLCLARGLEVPATDAATLAAWMHANANSGSLARYLRGFALTVAAMGTAEACERVA